MRKLQKLALLLMALFYLVAGMNHFIHPKIYLTIIPPYLPWPETLNVIAGLAEIFLAILLFPFKSRKWACYGIILMLLAFMPAHIFMIEKAKEGPYLLGNFTISLTTAWLRIPFQLVFILWAFWCSRMKIKLT